MKRVSVDIEVLGGSFTVQQLVFAHLFDAAPYMDLEHVDVICGADPRKRLGHYFAPEHVDQIEDSLGLFDTVVLVLPGAGGPLGPTDRLQPIGRWTGTRRVPG